MPSFRSCRIYNFLLSWAWKWSCLLICLCFQEFATPNTWLTLIDNCYFQLIIGLLVFFVSPNADCHNIFVSQQITENSFLFGFVLSITYFIQGALYAFKADTISALGFYWKTLVSLALVEYDNSVTSNQLLIIRMCFLRCSYLNHYIYLKRNLARLCTHCFPTHAFYLLLLFSLWFSYLIVRNKVGYFCRIPSYCFQN